MWEGGGVHGTHEALLLQAAAGGSGAAGADYGHHAALLPPWLGPAAAAPGFSYMSPHHHHEQAAAGPFGAEAAAASAPFGGLLGGYSDGGGAGHQLGAFGGLEPPPHALGHLAAAGGGPRIAVSGILGTLQAELGRMRAKEIMEAKALAASRSHSEAERRRRQRINSHLARLRSLLPNTTKTDKASLLAEVIEHVKELKRQTSAVLGGEEADDDHEAAHAPRHHHHRHPLLPTEADELAVDAAEDDGESGRGRIVVRASLCCEDRAGLIPDIARALAALRLRARRAEIATLGGRVRNVLLITAAEEDEDEEEDGRGGGGASSFANRSHDLVASIQEALRGVMDRKTATSDDTSSSSGGAGGGSGSTKRQRMSGGTHEQGSL